MSNPATDESVSTAATMIRALANPTDRQGRTVPDAVRASPLRAVPPLDILRAYHELLPAEGARLRRRLRHVVATALNMYGPMQEVARALLVLYREDPALTLQTAAAVCGQDHYMRALVWDPVLGELPKDLYDALRVELGRDEYLRRVVPYVTPSLAAHELELASTLSREWEGTLASLVATARAMVAA